MRVVKKETLKLISGWVERSNDSNMVLENFIPPLLDAVLLDYQRCTVPAAREPEVLSTMATTVNKLKGTITPQIPKIFDAVFECTLDMINKVSFLLKTGSSRGLMFLKLFELFLNQSKLVYKLV